MNKKPSPIINKIETILPMTFSSFLIFLFVVYLFTIIGQTIYKNYVSNKSILEEENKVLVLKSDLADIQNQINYYQTSSFKEKEARAKLGYKAPGENVIALPIDTQEEKNADSALEEVRVRTPNYKYWWSYFFG